MEINYFGTIALTKALLPSTLSELEKVVMSSNINSLGASLAPIEVPSLPGLQHALHGFDAVSEHHADAQLQLMICPGFI